MKKALTLICLTVATLSVLSSCNYEKTYYHNKNGRIKHVRARKSPAWFVTKERGYSKHTRRVMKRWDRGFR